MDQIKKDLTTALNDPQKLDPPCYLLPEEIDIDNKKTIRLFVPESSQVHRCNGKIYDRDEDGDFDITSNTNLVTAPYIRKQTTYNGIPITAPMPCSDGKTLTGTMIVMTYEPT